MKLAEALILRADAQKRIQQLRERLARSARVQEGDEPPEDPQALIAELGRVVSQFTDLVKQINRTNAQTQYAPNQTLTDALADRDALALERNALAELINAAVGPQQHRFPYGLPEVKSFRAIKVAEVQERVDDLARRYRELDSAIQAMNWNVELIE
jgi:hypothetical protein